MARVQPAIWFYVSAGRIWQRLHDGHHRPVAHDEVPALKFELAMQCEATPAGMLARDAYVQLIAVDFHMNCREQIHVHA